MTGTASTRPPRGHGRRVWRPSRGALYYLGLGLSAGLFGLVLLLALVVVVIPKVSGSVPMTILTTSMQPTLPPGTLIVVRPVPVSRIRVGDVLTYQLRAGDPAVISHRVVSITSETNGTLTFTTKGDNNRNADPAVTVPQVRGIVWYSVPLLGYVNNAVNGAQRSWIMPVLAMGLLGYASVMIVAGFFDAIRKRRRAQPAGRDLSRLSDGGESVG